MVSLHSFFGERRVLLICVLTLAGTACAASEDADEPSVADAGTDAGGDGDGDGDASTGIGPITGSRIYATVSGTDSVVVLDEASHEVLGSWHVGDGPAIVLATPGAERLYTANWADNSVSAIDTAAEAVTNIAVAGRPYVIAMPPSGDTVYAGLSPTGIAVIDTATDTITRTIPTSELAASIIVSPDGETLYVATFPLIGNGSLHAFSAADGSELQEPIEVGAVPAWVTINPSGTRVYTLNFLSDDISVVDTESWEVVATVDTGAGSQAIIGGVTPDGSRLYVTNHGTGELMGIDTTTNEIVQTIPLDGRPVGIQFNADGTRAYITDFGVGSLDVAADLNYLLTGNLTITNPGQISVYDIATGELVGDKVTTGPGPTSVVVSAAP